MACGEEPAQSLDLLDPPFQTPRLQLGLNQLDTLIQPLFPQGLGPQAERSRAFLDQNALASLFDQRVGQLGRNGQPMSFVERAAMFAQQKGSAHGSGSRRGGLR
jgi:hypothetical protein